jgi:O-6-methylguanine DNA methyltransferase
MGKDLQIAMFDTEWGVCGILACGSRIVRFSLPGPEGVVQRNLTEGIEGVIDRNSFIHKGLQNLVVAYFRGRPVDFGRVEVDLSGLTEFQKSVLTVCRTIGYGKTISYSDLAGLVGRPRAVRAAGSAVAANPIPLIIPCHRILCKNGDLGGFSAFGGVRMKSRLLKLEGAIS